MEKERRCVDCGRDIFIVRKRCVNCQDLEKKKVNSRLREYRKQRALTDLDYCSSEVFKKYKQRSPSRGLAFSLTLKDFRCNIEKPCHYCGGHYIGLGFDRVDNEIGYHLTNVVPCCPECNRMKRTQKLDDFIDRCIKIANNHG